MSYYKNTDKKGYEKILSKKEFNIQKSPHIYQAPHQILLKNYISKPTIYDNILLYHDVGVGKTCAAISIAEGFREYVLNMGTKIVVLVKNKNIHINFINELFTKCADYITEKERQIYFKDGTTEEKKEIKMKVNRLIGKTYKFITYGSFVNRVIGAKKNTNYTGDKENDEISRSIVGEAITHFNNTVVIVDEVHNATNNNLYVALNKVLLKSTNYRLVLLTATPIYDNPKEIFEISNLLNIKNKQFPIRNNLKDDYIQTHTSPYQADTNLKGGLIKLTKKAEDELFKSFIGKVSFMPQNKTTNPKMIEFGDNLTNRTGSLKVVFCKMSDYQNTVYKIALENDKSAESGSGNLYKNSNDASTIVYNNSEYGKQGFENIGNRSILKKQNLNKYSSKLFNILENIESKKGTHFIYSNYVSYGGTNIVAMVLKENGYNENISNGEFKSFLLMDEKMSIEKREKYRNIFNDPKNKDGKYIKILIGSPMISEGITLKNVRNVHLLEPSWNLSKTNQIIGRAVRNRSHFDLPESERYVNIFKYVAIGPEKILYIDKEKYILSEEKDRINKKVERLLKEVSFDCSNSNKLNGEPGTASCDYTTCDVSCVIKHMDPTDTSTYDLYIKTFENNNIIYVENEIKKLFKLYFIWDIDHIIEKLNNVDKKIIYIVLNDYINNKKNLTDIFNRDGFLIRIGHHYVFNVYGKDTRDSLYSKYFDFDTIEENNLLVGDYIKEFYNYDESDDIDITVPINKSKSKSKGKGKDPEESKDTVKIDDNIIKYNNNILANNKIIGSYRSRDGKLDNKFRIIDKRNVVDTTDMRKNISGKWISSFSKDELKSIAILLKLKISNSMDKDQLSALIKDHLVENKIVLQ